MMSGEERMFLRFLLAGSFSALFPVEIFRIQIDIDIYLCFWRSFLWRIFGNFFGQFIFRHDSCLFKILLVDLNFRFDRRIRRWLCLPLFLCPFFFNLTVTILDQIQIFVRISKILQMSFQV